MGIGIDIDPQMIEAARRHTLGRLANVSFEVMAADALTFPAESFDGILARQAPISVPEVVRLLRPTGTFITQQVGGRNTQNLFEVFGWGPNGAFWDAYWRDRGLPPQTLSALNDAFANIGCRTIAWGEYDVGYTFLDVESLIFWLKAVPLPEAFDID